MNTTKFAPGDRVVSSRYGPGTVTGKSARPGYVLASFGEVHDNQYNELTGARYGAFGSDTIQHEEAT